MSGPLDNDTRPHVNGFIQPYMKRKAPFSVEAPGVEKKDGETIPRRNPMAKDGLLSQPSSDVSTTWENLQRSVKKFGNAKAMGFRKLVQEHVETKKVKKIIDGKEEQVDKKWTFYELGKYEYLTYVEFEKLALELGSGLAGLGLTKQNKLHVYGATSARWFAVYHGAASQSIPIVTAYDSLGPDGLKHSLKQTGSKAIFLDPNLLGTLANVIDDAPDIEHIIYNTEPETKTLSADIEKLKSKRSSLTIQSFDELQKSGASKPVTPNPPTPDDLCCIMYTSGSTGAPKGVILKQRQVIASMAGVQSVVAPYIGPSDAILTYLPQSHILEFVFEHTCLFWGATMGYANPKTLSDASVRNCKGDIREFQPTILIGVPAVWESVKKGVIGKVNAGSFIVKNLFWGGLSLKQTLLGAGLPGAGIIDAIVFKKVKEATGGRLRVAFTAGGPISQETVKFISYAITPMISGYGLTETSAMGCIQDPLAWDPTALGDLTGAIEVKLVDFADAGYFTSNNPPQGEVWIRGPAVTEGYFENEKETQEALTEDGWFKTGDIGQFNANGHLMLIDRKKNLVKTLNGEYIAIEKLESTYKTAPLVGNICVYAASDKAKPIAIVVPVEATLQKLAAQHGIEAGGIGELAHNKKVNDIVLKELQKTGRHLGLNGIEIIEGVVVADDEWTPQNGFLSAAQKLQRKKILDHYKKEVKEAYGDA